MAEDASATGRTKLGAFASRLELRDDDVVEIYSLSSSTTFLISLATTNRASSQSLHLLTGLALVGRAWSCLKGVPSQSVGRRITGITRASPAWCRSIARFISIL